MTSLSALRGFEKMEVFTVIFVKYLYIVKIGFITNTRSVISLSANWTQTTTSIATCCQLLQQSNGCSPWDGRREKDWDRMVEDVWNLFQLE